MQCAMPTRFMAARTAAPKASVPAAVSIGKRKAKIKNPAEAPLAQVKRGGNTNDAELARTIKKLSDDLARYDRDKAEIKAKAEGLAKVRDDASKRSGTLGLAISYFTVAIASASICLVTKKKPLWFVAIILSFVAIIQTVLAWTL